MKNFYLNLNKNQFQKYYIYLLINHHWINDINQKNKLIKILIFQII